MSSTKSWVRVWWRREGEVDRQIKVEDWVRVRVRVRARARARARVWRRMVMIGGVRMVRGSTIVRGSISGMVLLLHDMLFELHHGRRELVNNE